MKIYEEDLIKTAEFMASRKQWSRLYGMLDVLECIDGTEDLRDRIWSIMQDEEEN